MGWDGTALHANAHRSWLDYARKKLEMSAFILNI
jgi:hypothetical protein